MRLGVKNLLLVICVYNFATALAAWRLRNLPRSQGGFLGNRFNDRRLFCCVYGSDPCPVGHKGCYVNDRQVTRSDMGSPFAPLVSWMLAGAYVAAVAVRADKSSRFAIVAGMAIWWGIVPVEDAEAVHVLIGL